MFTRQTIRPLGFFLLAATANFLALFPVAKYAGIEAVDLPAGSLVSQAFEQADYSDAYRMKLPPRAPQDIESLTRAYLPALIPCWSRESRRAETEAAIQELTLEPGSRAFGTVYAKTPDEILMGENEYHLNFRLSVRVSEEGGARWLTVSTVVHFNNWLGVAYFIPVRAGHQIIVPHTVRTAVHNLE